VKGGRKNWDEDETKTTRPRRGEITGGLYL
jgi:hypothetical protein